MVTFETVLEIHILYKRGTSIQGIASQLGFSRNSVRKYLQKQQLQTIYSPRPKASSLLAPWQDYIRRCIADSYPYRLAATVIYREIRQLGYRGSLTLLRYFLRVEQKQSLQNPLSALRRSRVSRCKVTGARWWDTPGRASISHR